MTEVQDGTFHGQPHAVVERDGVRFTLLGTAHVSHSSVDAVREAIGSGTYDLIVVNYANTDMVGHSGNLAATIKAVEAVDACLGRLRDAVVKAGGAMLITADHGNAETMRDAATGEIQTAHTLNRVPVVLVNAPDSVSLADGRLADIAPTVISLLRLPQPASMTGRSLIRPAAAAARERRASA